MKLFLLLGTLFLGNLDLVQAKTVVETVYAKKADITMLEEIVKIKNMELIIAELKKHNVDIYKVKRSSGNSPATFSFLCDAPLSSFSDLEEKLEEVDTGSAMFMSKDDIKNAPRNIILIADDADPMTVIHEFIHHLFEVQNSELTIAISAQQIQQENLLRRFNFKTRKVMLDNSLLMSKLWRDEIKELIEEYTASIDEGQGHYAAEEVAIEHTLLNLLLTTDNIIFDKERALQGINGYSQGLTIRSEGLIRNIFALSDLIITEGMDQDEETKDEERIDWAKRKAAVEIKLNQYLDGPIAKMRLQIKKSQDLLATVKN